MAEPIALAALGIAVSLFFKKPWYVTAGSAAGGIYDLHRLFSNTKDMAKMTGQLIACSLAIGYPFYSQSVSLIGFSLGCQVIKSILKTLNELGAQDIV